MCIIKLSARRFCSMTDQWSHQLLISCEWIEVQSIVFVSSIFSPSNVFYVFAFFWWMRSEKILSMRVWLCEWRHFRDNLVYWRSIWFDLKTPQNIKMFSCEKNLFKYSSWFSLFQNLLYRFKKNYLQTMNFR